MPPDPPREVPPSAVALSVPKKNPTFSQNLIGSTGHRSAKVCFFCTFQGMKKNILKDFSMSWDKTSADLSEELYKCDSCWLSWKNVSFVIKFL